jgi:hypothetical protein
MTVAALIARGVDPHHYITATSAVYRDVIGVAVGVVVDAEDDGR